MTKNILSNNYLEYSFESKEDAEYFWKHKVPIINSIVDLLEDGTKKRVLFAYNNIQSSYMPKKYLISIKYSDI